MANIVKEVGDGGFDPPRTFYVDTVPSTARSRRCVVSDVEVAENWDRTFANDDQEDELPGFNKSLPGGLLTRTSSGPALACKEK